MSHATITAVLLAALAAPAAANPLAQLLDYTGQIRGQMAVVEAQAHAAFDCLPRGQLIADDIYDELEDLCRDLDRLEGQIARPLTSRRSLQRLERLVERLDEQACKVQEAVHEAIADRRFRRHEGRHHQVGYAPEPLAYAIPGVPPHVLRKLPPHVVEHLVAARLGRASRGSTVSIGRGRFQLTIGTQPAVVRPVGYTVARPIGLVQQPVVPNPAGAALCAEADRLRLMTKQLRAIVCR